ncbi:MAG: hypothetical protein FJ279_01390 [Planctomycetes bacterium]|nr:hypothetical protein [Planctomycetota bacterium]
MRKVFGEADGSYTDADAATEDIKKEALRSKRIRYVSTYNTAFLAERYPDQTLLYKILKERNTTATAPEIKFLHLSPESRFTEIRAAELDDPPQYIRDGVIHALRTVRVVLQKLNLPATTVQVRHYDFLPIFRIVLFDGCAFIGFHKKGRMARLSPMLHVRADSELYGAFSRYFDTLWDHFSVDAVGSDEERNRTKNGGEQGGGTLRRWRGEVHR